MSELRPADQLMLMLVMKQEQLLTQVVTVVTDPSMDPITELLALESPIRPRRRRMRRILPILLFGESRIYPSPTARVDVRAIADNDAILRFRFTIPQLIKISDAMKLPTHMVTKNRIPFSDIEGLAIMLRRLSFPNALHHLAPEFGRDVCSISRIFNHMLSLLHARYGDHLRLWPAISRRRIKEYADSITRYERAAIGTWAFIDGTHRDIARPGDPYQQLSTFNGHDRSNQLRYQLILAPDGLFISSTGPWVGIRHDSKMFDECDLQDELFPMVDHTDSQGNGLVYMIYGDAAYRNKKIVMHPYYNVDPGTREARYNRLMSTLRVRIENSFGKTYNLFSFTSLKKYQRPLRILP